MRLEKDNMIRNIMQYNSVAGDYTFVLYTDTIRTYKYKGKVDLLPVLYPLNIYIANMEPFRLELIY
jgi:hypothetical protein